MIDKFTIGILLLAFVLSVSITVYEAGRVKELESRVSVLADILHKLVGVEIGS